MRSQGLGLQKPIRQFEAMRISPPYSISLPAHCCQCGEVDAEQRCHLYLYFDDDGYEYTLECENNLEHDINAIHVWGEGPCNMSKDQVVEFFLQSRKSREDN
jgi:hypothetical protein